MKRTIASISAALMLISALAACGEQAQTPSAAQTTAAQEGEIAEAEVTTELSDGLPNTDLQG